MQACLASGRHIDHRDKTEITDPADRLRHDRLAFGRMGSRHSDREDPRSLGGVHVVRFTEDAHGTIHDGYVMPESHDVAVFVLGWLTDRSAIV